MGPLLNGARTLVTQGMEKADVLDAFFTSIFTGQTGLQDSQASQTRGKVWSKESLHLVEEDQVKEHLDKLGVHKSV